MTMSIQTYTRGPWHWRHFGAPLALTTTHSGSLIVMDFVRMGMNGAQPRFGKRTDNMGGLMMTASAIYESEWDHPDMRLIAAAPMLYEALKALWDIVPRTIHVGYSIPTDVWDKVNAAIGEVEG